ncbi:MAG: type I-E CRISPR-associated protein Cse2/CasB [Casimicrobiaceae bacterium]|nr:type I-E CRISPR-associated protein Cse2/CasB [Casimicrobiaceae bacterium]MCX8098522.1 type I-E CRISPR-associated protein Cse2/CasB [Casimicrobiaceae bacterium]MDW8312121.1 type I-E CRISPR-associated protein Cse2/CasB [Burkholderiales bacterium]
MTDSVTTTAAPTHLAATVARLVGAISASHYPAGDRAALRRWAPGQPLPLAFYRLWLRHVAEDLPHPAQTEAWMLIAWSIATLGSAGHDPSRPWGQALAEKKFAEGRLERLLAAPQDIRADLFMSAIRFLATKGGSFDLTEAARFLLATDPAKRDSTHRRLAQAFYRHLPQND